MNNKQVKSEPTRIAQIIGKMWAGGVETVVFNYYRAIDHNKYQFDFYYDEDSTVDPPQDLIDLGARFYKLPPYQKLPLYIKELRRYLRKGQYDIVHSHLNTLSVFPLYCAWREKIPVRIAHNHSIPGGKEVGRNALKNMLKLFSRLYANEYFACSEKAGRWLFGDKLYECGRITVLKNAVDFSKFKINKETVDDKRKELKLSDEAFIVAHVGRFTVAKNHEKVISIFKAVKNRMSNAVLLLVGDGEERENIDKWIEQYGVKDSVIMTGKVSDPQNYYPLFNVLILPSVFEGVPVTVVESQIAGIPCVISNVVNLDVIISNTCYCLDIDDDDDVWARDIITHSEEHTKLNDNAINYNIEYAVKLLESKYDDLLKRK